MNDIYLDYAASSLKHFDIFKETIAEFEEIYANPSSNHALGKKNKTLLKNARSDIAKSLNAQPEEIIFTSGGTEANNMVFNHVANKFTAGEIIISNIEHPSVAECAAKLAEKGFDIKILKVDSSGRINIDELKQIISPKTVLVSIMFANNETGVLQPIEEIAKITSANNILLHSDIVQAYCKTEIDVKKLNINFASVSAHKIGGTNNFGFLYVKENNVTPLLIGGGQENGLRSGTSDPIGAVILQKCVTKTLATIEAIAENKNYFIDQLRKNKINFEVNGSRESLPNILNIYFPNIQAQRLITYLDINNIYISGGSACSSGNIKGSKIITEMYDEEHAAHSVRISLGFNTTKEMLDSTVEKIKQLEERILERGI